MTLPGGVTPSPGNGQVGVLPVTFNTVEVRGYYVDLQGFPVIGRVDFTPSVTTLVVGGEKTIVVGKTLTISLTNGRLSIRLPATDDPQVNEGYGDFFYQVDEIFSGLEGRSFRLRVPVAREAGGIDLSEAGPQPTGSEVGDGSLDGGAPGTGAFNTAFDGGGVMPPAP